MTTWAYKYFVAVNLRKNSAQDSLDFVGILNSTFANSRYVDEELTRQSTMKRRHSAVLATRKKQLQPYAEMRNRTSAPSAYSNTLLKTFVQMLQTSRLEQRPIVKTQIWSRLWKQKRKPQATTHHTQHWSKRPVRDDHQQCRPQSWHWQQRGIL